MINIENLKMKILSKSRFQDVIFITGIFAFSIILVLGLFPKTDPEEGAARISFVYLMMVIPIIVAIYFIIISFKRKLYSQSSEISSSITFKIALAFVFVAILSSIPIILISNNIINETISQLINEETIKALEESLEMSNDSIYKHYTDMERELKALDYSLNNGNRNPGWSSRSNLVNINKMKGYNTLFLRVNKKAGTGNTLLRLTKNNSAGDHSRIIIKFLENTMIEKGYRIYNISLDENPVLLGSLYKNDFLIAIYSSLPQKLYNRVSLYKNSLSRYKREDFLKPYFQVGIGIVLLTIAILVIIFAISLGFFLSRNITRPVLELANAAGDVASGNFNIQLYRDSSDELTLLYNSFNKMIVQLNESRKITFQMQKLEAWREVANKLLHEIKNPLTPIRLSAERIRKKFFEGRDDIEDVIKTGTDTIIEEVRVLTMMLGEFSKFARLPEMKKELQSINPVIENCVNSFIGHENIKFECRLDNTIPDIYFDRILFRQALNNILQNAAEAILESGNIYITSKFFHRDNNKFVRIKIKDDGVGIKDEYLGRVFDPTFTTKDSGNGIGLAIVNKIIFEHSGKITCNSVYGEGTEFTIDLPV